ncbi:MAG: sensor histidine kinase, partial [Alphaproteobacteria bacterium]
DLGPLGAPEYRQFAADIHASGKQLLDAINALLEINRVEAGTVQISARRRRLNAIVAEAIAKARRTCEDPNGVTFKTITAADDYEVEVDPERFADSLAHVIANANAIKFNKAGGGVSIETNRRPDGGLAIHVVDTGIGIAAKDIERVMEPFEQADNCLSRNFAGLGLGLPLARSLVRLHGGELTLESTLDVGSTVVVTLPRERLTRFPDA